MECGAEGRVSDGGVFRASHLYRALEERTLRLPEAAVPEYGSTRLPFVIVGDEAFPLKNYLMRPYSPLLIVVVLFSLLIVGCCEKEAEKIGDGLA